MPSLTSSLLGADRPRVELRPPAVDTLGPLAAELGARAGVVLEPWQRDSLDMLLSTREDGKWACYEYAELCSRRNGKTAMMLVRALFGFLLLGETPILWTAQEVKDLDVDTPILTTNGWSTMGELRDGDEVYAPDGQPTKVLAAHPVLRTSDCYRVRFADGQSVVAGSGHLWAVTEVSRSERTERRVVTTEEIRRAGLVHHWPRPQGRDRNVYRWRVDLPEPVQTPPADLPIDPYLFGMWLGDGDSSGGRLTVGEQDLPHVLAELDRLGERYSLAEDKRTNGRVRYVGVYGLRVRLRAAGVLDSKRIPDVYLRASVEQREALLAGIMDTDGTASGHQMVVTMVKRELMSDVLVLVRSLGYRATESTMPAKIGSRVVGTAHRVVFAPGGRSPFRMQRKTDAIVHQRQSRSAYNAIVGVDRVPIRPTRCITVAHESSSYVVGRGFIPTHNTSMRAWRDFRAMLWKLGERVNDNLVDLGEGVQVRINASNGKEGFERVDTMQELKMVARSKDSGRGFDADLVVIDEAYDFTADQQDALAPTQMARPNAQVGYLSSPPLSGTASESLYRLRERAEAGRGTRLGWRDWGRPESLDDVMAMSDIERTVFLDDLNIAATANPALNRGRVTAETISNMRDAMTDRGYAREVYGCWPKQAASAGKGWRVIPKDAWQARGRASERPAAPLVLAVAASWPDAERVSIGVAGAGDAGEATVYVVDHREGTSWVPGRLRELVQRWSPVSVLIDKKSPAARLIGAIEAEDVELTHPAMDDVATAAGEFYTAVCGDAPTLRHFDQPELDAAVAAAGKRPLGNRWTWQLQGSADISPLEAVTLARWGFGAFDDGSPNLWL